MTSDDGSPTPTDSEDVVDEDAMDEDVVTFELNARLDLSCQATTTSLSSL